MKSTKRSLLLSALSLILCVTMLLGTTYAWFTDSVSSGKNQIQAGNLDIELEYSKNGTTWATVKGATDLFGDVALWEPGATSVVYLKLTNKGTLALKYNFAIKSTGGDFTNVDGEAKNLKDALKFAQVAGPNLVTYATREAAVAATASVALGLNDYTQANHMAANDVSYITLVVTMPTSIDNEYNYKPGTLAPVIDLSIELSATQYSAESDSFDKYYDVTATPIDVYTVEEFNEALKQAKNGATINIMTAGLNLNVAYEDEKTFTLRGEKINTLTVNIPNGTVHVYNEVTTVNGTNVDLQNSAHFYNKVSTLNATAGHFVVEAGAIAETINTPAVVEKNLKIEIKGEVVAINVPKAESKVTVKVAEDATVTALNITDNDADAKIVLQNDGTVGNEATIKEKTQFAENIVVDEKVLTINNADEFKGFAKDVNGGNNYAEWTVKLGEDIDMKDVDWTPIGEHASSVGFAGTFDGNNKTVKNLYVENSEVAGLFGCTSGNSIVKNLTIDGLTVKGNHFAAGVVAYCGNNTGTVTNCTVKNGTITSVPEKMSDGSYDNGDKVGGIFGQAYGGHTITNNTVENVTITAHRDLGGVVGHTNGACTVTGNTVKGVTIIQSKVNGYKDNVTTVGKVVGRDGAGDVDTLNTITDVTFLTMEADGLMKDADGNYVISNANGMVAFANMVNGGTSFANKTIKLSADIDLAGKDWKPINGFNRFSNTVIDGDGHTIKNMKVTTPVVSGTNGGYDQYAGFIGQTSGKVTVKNLTFDAANIDLPYSTGAAVVCGLTYGGSEFENITVNNSTVNGCTKAGAIVGFTGGDNITVKLTNCKVENTTIKGDYSYALMVGLVNTADSVTLTGCSATNSNAEFVTRNEYDDYVTDAGTGYSYGKQSDTQYGFVSGVKNAWAEKRNAGTNKGNETFLHDNGTL